MRRHSDKTLSKRGEQAASVSLQLSRQVATAQHSCCWRLASMQETQQVISSQLTHLSGDVHHEVHLEGRRVSSLQSLAPLCDRREQVFKGSSHSAHVARLEACRKLLCLVGLVAGQDLVARLHQGFCLCKGEAVLVPGACINR